MANSGTTTYPAALDNYTNVTTSTYEDDTGFGHDTLHNQVHEAIEAIEATLGITGGSKPFYLVGSSAPAEYITDGTNDEVEIQAAIDAATTAGGGIVHLTKGTFNINSPGLAMRDNVILEGQGEATILKMAEAANYNIITSGQASEGNPTISAHHTVCRDFVVDGNKAIVTNSGSILWYLSTGATIRPIFENLRIYDQYGAGILLRNCTQAIVRNCYFSGNRAGAVTFYDNCVDSVMDGLYAENESGAQAFSIMGAEVEGQSISTRCRIINSTVIGGIDGIWLWSGVTESIVSNCHIQGGSGYGIRIYADRLGTTNYDSTDNIISNCIIEDIAPSGNGNGIRVESSGTSSSADRNLSIGNRVQNCKYGIVYSADADTNHSVGNILTQNITASISDAGAGNTSSGNIV